MQGSGVGCGTGEVLRAIRLVKKGTVYDLETVRWNLMPTWSGHPPFQVISYRTPHGIRIAGDHQDSLGGTTQEWRGSRS